MAAWGEPSTPSAVSNWAEPAQPAGLGQIPGYSWGETSAAAPTISPAVSAGGQFASAPQGYPPQQQSFNQGAAEAPKISAVSSRNSQTSMTQPLPDRRAPQVAAQAAAAAAQQGSDSQQGLFNLDDNAMDKLFNDNLGVSEGAMPAKAPVQQAFGNQFNNAPPAVPGQQMGAPPQPMMPQPNMPAPGGWAGTSQNQPAAAPQQQQQQGGLFSIDDNVIDRIFSENLGVPSDKGASTVNDGDSYMPAPQQAPMPQFNVNEAVNKITEAVGASPTPPPKIEGVGRLDSKIETVESGSGRIASIGKFLLDQKDLEKIGKITGSDFTDTKMRILTMEAAGELQALLQHIGAQDKVVGSVIVGHDGLLIANTMPSDMDAESIGVWALGVYMNTEHVIKKMGQDRVHQIVSRTPKGYLVIADFGGGLLVTVSDGKDTDTLIPLMRSITQLVQP
jgi:predicted regulator of Ras-like GTPase activity (Roadblock/LC7/MglB family)